MRVVRDYNQGLLAGTIRQLAISGGLAASTQHEERKKGKASGVSKRRLWKKFFRDSSKWWDNLNCKPSPRYPDFKHNATKEPLWADDPQTPSWVTQELNRRSLGRGDVASPPESQIHALVASLRVCTKNKNLSRGMHIHYELLQMGLLDQCSDALVTMYAKCGDLKKAQSLLDLHKSCDVITWTALVAGYAHQGQGQNALDCFAKMQNEGILPNAVTYSSILKACAAIGDAEKGREIHDEIARQGLLQSNIVLGGALVDMYAKCGVLSMAQDVLEGLPSRNVISWSALIAGYAQEGQSQRALDCFEQMQGEGILPNAVTYACVLKACAIMGLADKGKEIHDTIARQGLLQKNFVLGGALVEMYAKCGALPLAQRVLEGLPSRNVVSWSALATGYAQEGQAEQALNCFEKMQSEGILPDAVTYACIFNACATIGAVDKGTQIHGDIVRRGLLQNDIVLGSALVDMYAKCGALSAGYSVLKGLPARNVVSWNALIAGFAREGKVEHTQSCFEQMRLEGVLPTAVTYVCILNACANNQAADKGREINDEIVRQGWFKNDIMLGCVIVDMYVKRSAISMAQCALQGLPSRDVCYWNALIAGYLQEGLAEDALSCFEQMQHDGILPNTVASVCMLDAYRRLEVDQAPLNDDNTTSDLKPDSEFYTCMGDLFGHIGHLEKA